MNTTDQLWLLQVGTRKIKQANKNKPQKNASKIRNCKSKCTVLPASESCFLQVAKLETCSVLLGHKWALLGHKSQSVFTVVGYKLPIFIIWSCIANLLRPLRLIIPDVYGVAIWENAHKFQSAGSKGKCKWDPAWYDAWSKQGSCKRGSYLILSALPGWWVILQWWCTKDSSQDMSCHHSAYTVTQIQNSRKLTPDNVWCHQFSVPKGIEKIIP